MDPELKRMVEEGLALAKDNHRMLRAMRRDAWFSFFGQLLFWLVIIVGPLYFLAPYLGSLPSAAELQNLLNQAKLQK